MRLASCGASTPRAPEGRALAPPDRPSNPAEDSPRSVHLPLRGPTHQPSRWLRRAAAFGALGLYALPVATVAAAFAPAGGLPDLGGGRIWCVAADPAAPATLVAGTDSGLYASRDAGASWTQELSGVRVWAAGFAVRHPNVAVAGTSGQGVYTSTDSGTTWRQTSTGLPNLNVRALAFGLDGLAAGTDAGVAVSPDGQTWRDAGLDSFRVSAITVAANYPQFTLIAGADGGKGGFLFRNSGGTAWEVLQSGLPGDAVVSSLTAGPIDRAVPKRPILAATSKGIFRSGDGGTTWTQSSGTPEQVVVTTIVYSPLDPSLAYAGADAGGSAGGDLYRSVDSGTTFTAFDDGLPSGSRNGA